MRSLNTNANAPNPSRAQRLMALKLICALLTLSACSSSASARSLARSGLRVELTDAYGAQLPTYEHRGQTFVQGDSGERYQIRLFNDSDRRRELVVTVDGRDVINGQEGRYSHRGYVVDPYESVTIQGFRKSDTQVATFRFTSPSDSYSGRLGSQRNLGLIGVAVFEERPRPRPRRYAKASPPPIAPSYELEQAPSAAHQDSMTGSGGLSAAEPSPARSSSARRRPSPRKSELGTRYGEGRHSEVEEVSFKRSSSRPALVYTLHYDSERGLRRRGVIRSAPPAPSAFPAEPRYAPPPP